MQLLILGFIFHNLLSLFGFTFQGSNIHVWYAFPWCYSRLQCTLRLCKENSFNSFETAVGWCFWWLCSGKRRAWCQCWYLEPRCFVLWIFVWGPSFWGQGTLRHIQKVSMNRKMDKNEYTDANSTSFKLQ